VPTATPTVRKVRSKNESNPYASPFPGACPMETEIASNLARRQTRNYGLTAKRRKRRMPVSKVLTFLRRQSSSTSRSGGGFGLASPMIKCSKAGRHSQQVGRSRKHFFGRATDDFKHTITTAPPFSLPKGRRSEFSANSSHGAIIHRFGEGRSWRLPDNIPANGISRHPHEKLFFGAAY